MSSIEYRAELIQGRRQCRQQMERRPLSCPPLPAGRGGAVIMALFLFAALLRAVHHGLRPAVDKFGAVVGAAERGALARLRFHGPRRL